MSLTPIGARRSLIGPRSEPGHYKISVETKEVLHKLARKAEMSPAAFVASLIEVRCHGRAVVERIQAAHLEVVYGEYPGEQNDRDSA